MYQRGKPIQVVVLGAASNKAAGLQIDFDPGAIPRHYAGCGSEVANRFEADQFDVPGENHAGQNLQHKTARLRQAGD